MKTAKPQNKKGVIHRETEWWRFTKVILSFSHIWVCLVIAASAVLMLFVSWLFKDAQPFWSSICANIFAGLVTGLVICLIGGAKQISIVRMQSKKEWLQNLTGLLKVYLNDYHQMTRLHFDRFDGKPEIFDFYYDMSIHASNINVEIHQGTFNKALSFSPDQYCREAFGYDSVAMSERFDALHTFVEMIEIDCPGSKEIAQQFATVHSELRKLNSAVYGAIRDLDVRLADIQKTIV